MTIPLHNLKEAHREMPKRHFDELAEADVVLRFGSNIQPEVRHAYVDGINFERDAVFGVYADDLSLPGAAHLACLDGAAELGLSVLESYRGHGIGTALVNRAAIRPRNLPIVELFLTYLAPSGSPTL